jgi:hypothetical protein
MMLLTAMLFAEATAQAAMPTPGTKTNQAPTAKVECRMVAEAGTRIPTRICRLDKEWELLAKDAQDDMRTSRNKVLGDNANTQ